MVEKYGVKGVEALQLILAECVVKGWGAPSNAEFDEKKLEDTIIVQDFSSAWPSKWKIRRLRADSSEAI
ncbi:MAG TPA: hypothetical protein VIH48_03620 [Candidatus Bathyarchaeia archaeon]